MFCGGTMAGPKIAGIVRIHAVSNRSKSSRARQRTQNAEKFILAVIAAVSGIRAVPGIFHLVRFHKFVAHSSVYNKLFQLRTLVRGITWRNRRHREHSLTERLLRSPRQVGGIRPT